MTTALDERVARARAAKFLESGGTSHARGGRRTISKGLTAKVAVAATVVLIGVGAAAAAASLPGAAPSHDSHGHGRVTPAGSLTHRPDPGSTSGSPTSAGTVTSNRQGNGPGPKALPGLCRAKIASDGHPDANSVLQTIACAGVTPAGGSHQAASGPSGTSPATAPHSTGTPTGPHAGSFGPPGGPNSGNSPH